MSEILQKLLASFHVEQREHLEKIRAILGGLVQSEKGPGPELDEAFRRAHSLKGAARAVDLRAVETLAHGVETIFSRIREGSLALNKKEFKAISLILDSVEDWVSAYFQNEIPPEPVKALEAVRFLLGTDIKPPLPSQPPRPAEASAASADDGLLVKSRDLERILGVSDRTFAETLTQEIVSQKLAQVESQVREVDLQWDRIKSSHGRTVRQLATSPKLAPIARHLDFVERQMRFLRRQFREIRQTHSRSTWGLKLAGEHLREEIRQVRMVPAESVFQGFRKMLRDLARDENKEVEFDSGGFEVEADRLVLQALKDPLMHLLRNAICHGIEASEERQKLGKAPVGKVRLRLKTRGNLLDVSVQDDGRGISWKAVAECAVSRGFLSQEDAGCASREDLSRLLFLPGFSTSRMVTELAGRGMGLSVVGEAAKRLQGGVDLESQEGRGVTLTLTVPLSVSTHRLLLVKSASQTFAIPMSGIERLARIPLERVETMKGKSVVSVGGRTVPVSNLSGLLGLGEPVLKLDGESVPLVILKSSAGSLALAVDSFVGERSGTIKNLGGGAQRVKTFSGAILGGDGSPVLVLDPAALVQLARRSKLDLVLKAEKNLPAKAAPVVLVADDSITTRTLEKSILEAHGYRVVLAVDGEEALQRLRCEKIDLVIVDLQMPRMDGFQTIEQMKREPALSKIPVIIVSSLESREEKERGLAVGADAYIVKRKFDHKGLLETIRQIL